MLGTRHPYRREEQETIESASRAALTGAASLAANAQPMESITSRLTWCTTSLGRSWYSRLATQLVRRSTMGGDYALAPPPRLTGPRRVLLKY